MSGNGVKSAAALGLLLALYAGGKSGHMQVAHLTAASPGQVSTGANVALGRRMAAQRGWAGGQWDCLDWLWTRESGWNALAANPTSDARGIPQDINGWRDFPPGQPAPQITWGLDYIDGRYGSPCAAWAHEMQFGWY